MSGSDTGRTPDDKRLDNLSAAIQVLRPLDPTLVEKAEHPVVTLVQVIHEQIEGRKRRRDEVGREQYDTALKKLAEGLSVLEGVGKDRIYEGWEDAAVVAESALTRAASGAKLAIALEEYANAALAVAGKRAFLLTIDDIDTQFERGWPMIEALRKYFNIPRFIVVLAGDLSLYSLLVRRAQYENLGDGLLRQDRAHRDHHRDQDLIAWQDDHLKNTVDGLQAQYMLKVMKPENRINLKTMEKIVELERVAPVMLQVDGSIVMALSSAVELIFRSALCLSRAADLEEHRRAILRQPVRVVAQFLAIGRNLLTNDAASASRDQHISEFRNKFIDLAASALEHHHLSSLEVQEANPTSASSMLVEWLERTQLWDDGHHLRPRYLSDDLNMVAMSFASRFADFVETSVGEAFGYFIRVCMTRYLVVQADGAANRRRILDFLAIGVDRPLVDCGRRWVVAQRSLLVPAAGVAVGTIPIVSLNTWSRATATTVLYGMPVTVRGESMNRAHDNARFSKAPHIAQWINDVREYLALAASKRRDFPAWLAAPYNTPAMLAESMDVGRLVFAATAVSMRFGGTSTAISSIVLLGAAADSILGSAAQRNAAAQLEVTPLASPGLRWPDEWRRSRQAIEETRRGMEELQGADYDEGATESVRTKAPSKQVDLAAYFAPQESAARMHCQVLAAACDRFWSALVAMDDRISSNLHYAGWLLERHLVVLKNALLVEEADYFGRLPGRQAKNPIFSDKEFRANRDTLMEAPTKEGPPQPLQLLSALESCTFLNAFLPEWTSLPESSEQPKRVPISVRFKRAEIEGENRPAPGILWDALNTMPVIHPGRRLNSQSEDPVPRERKAARATNHSTKIAQESGKPSAPTATSATEAVPVASAGPGGGSLLQDSTVSSPSEPEGLEPSSSEKGVSESEGFEEWIEDVISKVTAGSASPSMPKPK
jgi:hypothetical protein